MVTCGIMKTKYWALILLIGFVSMAIERLLILFGQLGFVRLTESDLSIVNLYSLNWTLYGGPLVLIAYFIDYYRNVKKPGLKLLCIIWIEFALYLGAYILSFSSIQIPWFYVAAFLTLFIGYAIKGQPNVAKNGTANQERSTGEHSVTPAILLLMCGLSAVMRT